MKFVCDACGKKYATSEDPSPGKVYKLKCKACGHLIVVKAQAGTSTGLPAITAAERAMTSAPPVGALPEIELEIEPDPRQAGAAPPVAVDDEAIMQDPSSLPPEVASAIDGAAPLPTDPPKDPFQPLAPPPIEKDELADFAAAAAEVMAEPSTGAGGAARSGYVDLFGDGITGERPVKDDALSAAARSSLPASYAGKDPLAAPKAAAPAPRVAPRVEAPKPGQKGKGPSPLIFAGLGAALLVGVTILAIKSSGDHRDPPQKPAVTAPIPALPPAPLPRAEPAPVAEPRPKLPEPKPEPRAEPAKPKPEPKAEPPRPKPPEPRPEPRPKPPEPKPEPKAEPPRPAPAPAPAPVEARTETRDVQLPDAEATLTPEVVQKVINANRKAFASCIAAAGPDVKMDGRKVALKLTVNANGAVTYPTLDDVTLNPTEMGQCLKSAARLMIFPKFKGDPFHVEVPLTLSN